MKQQEPIELEAGWSRIERDGFRPLQERLDGTDSFDLRTTFNAERWVEIYTTVYRMCTQKDPAPFAEQLYLRLGETMSKYLTDKTLPALRSKHGYFLLKELVKRWENHKIVVRWVKRIFEYIDRYYVKRHESIKDLQKLGYYCFYTEVFARVKNDVRRAAIDIIERERDGEQVDHALLKSIVNIYVEMGMGENKVYAEDLETAFLTNTSDFYCRVSAKWAAENSFPEFMVQAEKCIAAELARSAAYLDPQTETKLMNVVETEVLVNHQERMLEKEKSGFVVLLEQSKRDDLARLYRLYSRVNVTKGLVPVASILRKHVESEGMAIVADQRNRVDGGSSHHADKPDFLQSLLSLHDRYHDLVVNCFDKNADLQKAVKEAFEVFVNQQVGKCSTAELFANYCDSLLSSSGFGSRLNEEELEDHLEKFCNLFNYLSEKDVFQGFALKQLAKRLLLEKSHSEDAESSLITKLKDRCGAHYTSKLSGMITDMKLTKDIQSRFRAHVLDKSDERMSDDAGTTSVSIGGVDCSVRVLTTGHWPTYQEDKLQLPIELERCVTTFKEFYDVRTSQRILKWVHSLGKGTMETTAFTGNRKLPKIELQATTYQMCILMLYNDADELTFRQIRESLGVESDDGSKQSVMSLCKKHPLLVRSAKSKEITDDDVFKLNVGFAPNRWRISIPVPVAKISEAEKEATHSSVVEDRKHAIEAAIVRVMKSKKELEHQQLIAEVSAQLTTIFQPEPRQIKNRVEDLITREYLERDPDKPSMYRYLA